MRSAIVSSIAMHFRILDYVEQNFRKCQFFQAPPSPFFIFRDKNLHVGVSRQMEKIRRKIIAKHLLNDKIWYFKTIHFQLNCPLRNTISFQKCGNTKC